MNFSELKGNENLKNSLNSLEKGGRMPHAVIISGANAEARARIAVFLSKWAVCSESGERPCSKCKNCVNAEASAHSDIYRAKGSGKTNIYNADELKSVIRDVSLKPNQAKRKVYIFEECDRRLPEISQNILLKTLEEPPQDILFILTCENASSLLQTIRSRASQLSLDEKKDIDGEVLDAAKELVAGIVSPSEITLLRAAEKLGDRAKALEILDAAVLLLADALALYSGYRAELSPDTAEKLCLKLTKAQFLELIDLSREAQKRINQNVSQKLVNTWLCASYRRTVWQK